MFDSESYAQGFVAASLCVAAEALDGAFVYAFGHLGGLDSDVTRSIQEAQRAVREARNALSRL